MLLVLLIFVSTLRRRVQRLALGFLLVFGAGFCAVCVGNAGAAAGAGYELPSMPRNAKLQIVMSFFD